MSLIGHLRVSQSPIRQFLLEHFPNTQRFVREHNKLLAALLTIRPPESVDPQTELGIVGMALDYRLRYYFAITPPEQLVAWHGAQLLAGGGLTPGNVSSNPHRTPQQLMPQADGAGEILDKRIPERQRLQVWDQTKSQDRAELWHVIDDDARLEIYDLLSLPRIKQLWAALDRDWQLQLWSILEGGRKDRLRTVIGGELV